MSTEISSTPVVQQTASRVPAIISWVLILGLAGLIVSATARAGESPATQRVLNDERSRMSAMLAVYMKSLQQEAASAPLVRERMSVLIKQMESDARTANDKIRVAILAGEILGPDDAVNRLNEISETGTAESADILVLQAIYTGSSRVDLEEKSDLIQRHGYLGRLAAAYGVPADKEPRKTLQSEAFWFAVKLSFLGVGLVILMGLSLAGFILAIVWYKKEKIRSAYV